MSLPPPTVLKTDAQGKPCEILLPFRAPDLRIDPADSTFPRILRERARRFPLRRCFGTREFLLPAAERSPETPPEAERGDYEWYSFLDVFRMASELYHGLKTLNIPAGSRVGIMSVNRTEWTVADVACASLKLVTVPIYDSQSASEIEYVCKDAGVVALFTTLDKLEKWEKPLTALPEIRHVVLFDDRYDDRSFLLRNSEALGLHLPEATSLAPKPFEVFDQYDRTQGHDASRPLTSAEKASRQGTAVRMPRVVKCPPCPAPSSEAVEGETPLLYAYSPDRLIAHTCDARAEALRPVLARVTHTFHSLCAIGREAAGIAGYAAGRDTVDAYPAYPHEAASPDDLMSLIYTSGTTGMPKGTMIHQRNAVWTATSMQTTRLNNTIWQLTDQKAHGEEFPISAGPIYQEYLLSFLPNAHIFQRVLQGVNLLAAGATGFWQGSMKGLVSDIQALRPTYLVVVPRVLQKLFEGIMSNVEQLPKFKRFVFFSAYNSRRKALKAGRPFPAWTRGIFKTTKNLVGGRVQECVSGSAPMSQKVGEFLRIVCDMTLFEGWGMSETAAQGAVQPVHTDRWGAIGMALDSSTRIKLVNIPEMDYNVTDSPNPRGEVWISGPSIFSAYWNDPTKTSEALVQEGDTVWFRTGDVGLFDQEWGQLLLIDRKRGIFKLSQGEYVSVSNVEDKMGRCKYVEQVFMYGNRYEPYVLGIAVPNFSSLRAALALRTECSDAELCERPEAIALVTKEVAKECRAASLRGFEVPKLVILEPEPWTPDNGMATPALKLKRPAMTKRYEPLFLDVYRRINREERPTGGSQEARKLSPEDLAQCAIAAKRDGPLSDSVSAASGSSGFTGVSASTY